jgi:hypothetical protein
MTRLRWERSRFVGKPKLNIEDEKEWFDDDRAARWLERAEKEKAKRMRRPQRNRKARKPSGLPSNKRNNNDR